jgi:lysophospholipase L1-like esterase
VNQVKQILCFGDSNTYGLIPATGDRYGWGVRWTSILDERVRADGYRVIEEGLCGRTTVFDDPLRDGRRGTDLLPTLLETHKPIDILILMLGTNDCKTFYDASAEVIGRGVERLLDQAAYANPSVKVLLVSPIHLGDEVWKEQFDPEFSKDRIAVSKKLAKVYRQIAIKRNIAFLAASDFASPSDIDREHLDEKGHVALADAIYKALDTV